MKTDEEVIKGLDSCCVTHNCKNCPYLDVGTVCIRNMQSGALSLIKRQQAEIEKLKIENQSLRSLADERICTMKKIDNRTNKRW